MLRIEELDLKLKKIWEVQGETTQTIQFAEECAELTKAVTKLHRKVNNDCTLGIDTSNLVEEMADVLVLMEQFRLAYHIAPIEIQRVVEQKIERTMKRLEDKK